MVPCQPRTRPLTRARTTANPHLLLKVSYAGSLLYATLVQCGCACGTAPAPVPRGIGGGSRVTAKPDPIPGIDQANVVAFPRSDEAVAAVWFADHSITDRPVPPWELPGNFRLDCEPHRAQLLQVLRGLSLGLGPPGGLLTAVCAWGCAKAGA